MPIPDTPYTRKEAYLNAVATGDSSGIPETPYTREEMYLDYIARNGGGGGGGSSGILVVHVVEITGTENFRLDKTWQEIWDAQTSGVIVAISNGYVQGNTAEWSCAPILMINCNTDYGLWSVYELGGVSWNCLGATDYPQTGIG